MRARATFSTDGLDRLAAAVARETAKDLWSISDEAWDLLQAQIRQLGTVSPAELGVGSDRTTDDTPEALVAGLRTFARNLAAVFTTASDPKLIAHEVAAMVGNPNLTHEHWVQALRGRKGDPSVTDMRRCAWLLRDGFTVAEATAKAGVSRRQGVQLSRFLGVQAFRRAALVSSAADAIEAGLGMRAWWRQWNDSHPQPLKVSRGTAAERYQEARQVLGLSEAVSA